MRLIRVHFNSYEHRLDRRIGLMPFGNGVQFDLWWCRMFVYRPRPPWDRDLTDEEKRSVETFHEMVGTKR
jgi:hypothetical protein